MSKETVFIGVAWPYANGPLHLGHIAGAYLPADIFARFHRLKGDTVLMVSGSDQHGTPITIAAGQEGTTPEKIAGKYHLQFLESWDRLGISFDLFTSTGTENHARVTHDIFLDLLDKGFIYRSTTPQAYCASCSRFLPDRYIEGTCPQCGGLRARGDQCDECGKPLNPSDLISSRCSLCGGVVEFRDSEHFFLKLSAFEERLLPWINSQSQWRPNVQNFTRRFIEGGLRDRAITRDIEWGVSVPYAGFEDKRIYVWFEAVIGYLSASKEWAHRSGRPEAWRDFWTGEAKSYYFIGKDNIPFHTIIWPAMLMGYGGLALPYNVPANEFLTIEGKKLSTSRKWAIWVPDYLERYAPDPLRFYLAANMPETGDADFSWPEFVRRNNGELVGTYGNLAHRVLTFLQRHFEGRVPVAGQSDGRAQRLIDLSHATLDNVAELLGQCRFREALKSALSLAQEANRYLDEASPWKSVASDRSGSGTSLYTILVVLSSLKTVLWPFLPFSSQKLHQLLGFPGRLEEDGWKLSAPEPGTKLPVPSPLFTKLEDEVADEELARLRQAAVST